MVGSGQISPPGILMMKSLFLVGLVFGIQIEQGLFLSSAAGSHEFRQ